MGLTFEGFNGNKINATTDNEMQVALTQDITKVGSVAMVSEVHDGISGVERLTRAIEVSADYRLRVGIDTLVYYDYFSTGTILNTHKYTTLVTTQTVAQTGQYVELNSSGITTVSTGSMLKTWGYFPTYLSYTTYFDTILSLTQPLATNCVSEWGFFYVASATTPQIGDGILFRKNSGGELQGVIVNNGTDIGTVTLNYQIVSGNFDHYLIAIHNDEIHFWINDVLYGSIKTPLTSGNPTRSMTLPICYRTYNTAVAPSIANKVLISSVLVGSGDLNQNKPFSHVLASSGNHSMVTTDGVAVAQTSNNVNNTAPVSIATFNNTTAGYSTLGGQFQFASVSGAETDYPIFAYQVPSGNGIIAGKELVVSRITIDTFNMGQPVATTPTLLQWSVGIGSSAVSLATVDGATTRSPKRLNLGIQYLPVGAVVGQPADKTINVTFDPPLVIDQSSYFHIILKMPVATLTSGQIIRGIVSVNGHFE